jgi:hypothetical protein
MATFEKEAQTQFVESLRDYLRTSYAAVRVRLPMGLCRLEEIPESVLTELVTSSIEKGRLYSLTWQSSLAAFVTLRFVAGPNFDSDPAMHWGLTDPAVPANNRVDGILRWATETDWGRIRAAYDPAAWAGIAGTSKF